MAEERKPKASKPAGKDDNVEVNVVDMKQIEGIEGPETQIPNHAKYDGIRSDDLDFGISIQAYDGGKPKEEQEYEKD